VNRFLSMALLMGAISNLPAAELKPETSAAFDRYVKITEDGFAKQQGFENFLWLDHHSDEKTLVWLQQSIVKPMKTLDQGKEIEVPGGVIQHWLGVTYLENADADHVRGLLMNLAAWKGFFKDQIIDSRVNKHDGDDYDFNLRFYKKQFSTVVLNVHEMGKYTLIDPTKWTFASRSIHVGEAEHPKNAKNLEVERSAEETAGYLWNLNFYWRVQQSDNGCYVELEVITLANEEPGRLHAAHYKASFQNFPHDFTQYMIDALEGIFPHHK
jgi:hypothetical protein